MATAFVAVVTVRNAKGQINSVALSGSDVTAEYLKWPDLSTTNKLSSLPCKIIDFVFPSSSISQCKVYINGIDTGIRVQKSASAGTTVNRQVQSAPIDVPAGASLTFEQLT